MMTAPSPRYLLLGAGYTLTTLARLFAKEQVVLTTRSEEKCARFRSEGYQAEVLSIRSGGQLRDILSTYPTLTAIVDSIPPLLDPTVRRSGARESLPQGWLSQALFGVKNVVAVASSYENISRVVYLSTTGVFGVTDGSWVDEQTPTRAENPRVIARVESENLYRSLHAEVVVVRPSAIYGPGRGILPALKAGNYPLIEGNRWSNRIHVEDLARIIKAVLEQPSSAIPHLLCASDSEPSLSREVVEFYCNKFSLPIPPTLSLAEATNRGLSTMLGNQRISNRLVRERLGYSFLYPDYRAGAQAA